MSDSDPRDYRSLGDLLRDARTERKLSYEQVNEATKISPRVLAALEKDDLDAASGPIYARGFVRTLAKFYDLDPEWLGAKLDQLAGETSRPVLPVEDGGDVIAGPIADPVRDEPAEPATPKWEVESTRVRKVGSTGGTKVPRNAVVVALVAVLIVAVALVWLLGRGGESRSQGARGGDTGAVELAALDEDPGPASTLDSLTAPVDTTTVEPATRVRVDVPRSAVETIDTAKPAAAGARGAAESADSGPVPVESQPETTPATTPDRATETGEPTTAPPREPAPAGDDEAAGPVDEGEDVAPDPVTPGSASDTAAASPEPPAQAAERDEAADEDRPGLPSVVRPSEEPVQSWAELRVVAAAAVEVTLAADGGPAETRRLAEGEVWSLRGSDHFSLAVSDPAAVRLEMNGTPQAIPRTWTGEERILYPPQSGQ